MMMLHNNNDEWFEFSELEFTLWYVDGQYWRPATSMLSKVTVEKLKDSPAWVGVSHDSVCNVRRSPLTSRVNYEEIQRRFHSVMVNSDGIIPMDKMSESLYEALVSIGRFGCLNDEAYYSAVDELSREAFRDWWRSKMYTAADKIAERLGLETEDDVEDFLYPYDEDDIYIKSGIADKFGMADDDCEVAFDEDAVMQELVEYFIHQWNDKHGE